MKFRNGLKNHKKIKLFAMSDNFHKDRITCFPIISLIIDFEVIMGDKGCPKFNLLTYAPIKKFDKNKISEF